eukprot:gene23133-29493_t
MLFSNQHAVRTEALLRSFGWSKDEVYQQHDAHELFSLLFSALEESSSEKTKQALQSFQGDEETSLHCPECRHTQKTLNKYNCLSVDVPANGTATTSSLPDLLARLTAGEILDEDN